MHSRNKSGSFNQNIFNTVVLAREKQNEDNETPAKKKEQEAIAKFYNNFYKDNYFDFGDNPIK